MPIKEFMTKDNIVTFDIDDYVDDVKETMSKIRHRDFPILDENGYYIGMVFQTKPDEHAEKAGDLS